MFDDKPCPRCRSLHRDFTDDLGVEYEVCLTCGLRYRERRWLLPDGLGTEYTDEMDAEVRRYGWKPVIRRPDPLLSSPDLPPLPWSSPADRQPWPDQAADPRKIVDANGRPLFGGRNWKEPCAAIEFLVRSANRVAAESRR